MISKVLVFVLFVVFALHAAGAASASSTPSQYRSQALAICTRTHVKLSNVAPVRARSEVKPFLKVWLPIARSQYNQLRQLSPPAAVRSLHTKALSLEKQRIDAMQASLSQIERGADPEKAFHATDAKLTPIIHAEIATWQKLQVSLCASI